MHVQNIELHKKGLINGVLASAGLSALVLIGSRRLLYFDAALVPYLFATLFAVMGVVYRYTVWLDRPPTKRLWRRSLQYFLNLRLLFRLPGLIGVFIQQVILQRFVGQRSFYRWLMHFTLAWGTLLAFMVTFPLVFGWLHFETVPGDPHLYQLYTFGFSQFPFHPDGVIGFFFFNALNFCSLLVMTGTIMAFTRRILHPDVVAGQTFMNDMLPLLILFSVAVTGLFLTYSTRLLDGQHYRVLSTIHCFTVVVLLVYLPFGKLFHIFQRGAQMGASVYLKEKKAKNAKSCISCNSRYVSLIQYRDVSESLKELGFRYHGDNQEHAVQDLCPLCRRRLFMWSQHKNLKGQFDAAHEHDLYSDKE